MAKEPKPKEEVLSPEEQQVINDQVRVQKDLEVRREKEGGEKMFTEQQVKSLLKQALAEAKKEASGISDESLDEEDPYAIKTVRLPRFTNKFVCSFKQMNEDEYSKDRLFIPTWDVFNPQKKQYEPYVTAIFDDGSELSVPLLTLITRGQQTFAEVPIVDIITKDTSYSAGKTESKEVRPGAWDSTGTGQMVKMKVTQHDYAFKVTLPNGKDIEVSKDVVNW